MNRGLLLIVAAAGVTALTVIAFQRSEISRLRVQSSELQEQLQSAGEAQANAQPPPVAEPAAPPQGLSDPDLRELLRLRNEVTQLRAEQQRAKQLETENVKSEKAALNNTLSGVAGRRFWAEPGTPAGRPPEPLPRREAWIGVSISPGEGGTIMIGGVAPNSPAAQAQLQAGDAIVRIDGVAVTNLAQVRNTIATRQPGQLTLLEIVRLGVTQQVYVTPGAPPRELIDREAAPARGIEPPLHP